MHPPLVNTLPDEGPPAFNIDVNTAPADEQSPPHYGRPLPDHAEIPPITGNTAENHRITSSHRAFGGMPPHHIRVFTLHRGGRQNPGGSGRFNLGTFWGSQGVGVGDGWLALRSTEPG